MTGSAVATISRVHKDDRRKLSAWVRDQNTLGERAELTDDRVSLLATSPLPGLLERGDRLLLFIVRQQKWLGEDFTLDDPAYLAVGYVQNEREMKYLRRYLEEVGYLRSNLPRHQVTPKGYLHVEKLRTMQAQSAQGFVAMWFDPAMLAIYDKGFDPGIRRAGFDPHRVDRREHVGRVDDEIIAQIRRSRFVVADFTGHRGGVYFEAGFALGLNLPVVWTCRQDQIADLHFDIRQYNCITWAAPDELATKLQNRIEAVIGLGPRRV